ncbi:disease resistance protein [Striga asiatica]|uniref:Disease resistance protein n=1 Tax=Striga asiatica TaxID=4170 RepID=A0A5A7R7P2_STRAF|nr:disease resistance protein [Striga asiatica]
MAAYAALLSLTKTIDQIQNHPRPPISLDKPQIEPLIEKVVFLQDFLENYIIDDADGLEGRMIDAAHEAEDIIESHIADHFEALAKANITSKNGSLYRYLQKKIRKMTLCINNNKSLNKDDSHQNLQKVMHDSNSTTKDDLLYRNLQKVMHDLNSITKDVGAVKEKARKKIAPSCTEDDAMVGSDDVMDDIMDKLKGPSSEGNNSVMNDIMDKLTNQQSNRRIIALAGMGGIGKTTLAKRIYENRVTVEYFDIRGWATVSQEFDSKKILLQVLDCLKKTMGSEDSEYEELGQKLYQSLYGRRYLIVMDDIWGTDAWDGVKRFFPNNNDGSKVLITTRLSNVALQLDGPDYIQMRFLEMDESWNLLRRCVFQEQGCPPELEEIGKEIARNCRGLPLSIVVIGGLLAKSEQKRENWKHVLENLSSIVNLEEDESCFRILKLSYNQLPVHLKPCFLYMGMFPEDHEIRVPTLLKLWVAEGFVKPVAGQSQEKVARVLYLNELVLRNLILVRKWGSTRNIKRCAIHDLLRDLCIKEAEKYKFFRTMETITHNSEHDQSWRGQRRIGIQQAEWYYIPPPLPEAVESASRARTLIWNVEEALPSLVPFRFLRVLNASFDITFFNYEACTHLVGEVFHLVNLRHLVATAQLPAHGFPPPFYRLWNLQTLIFDWIVISYEELAVLDIWRMPQLRHVKVRDIKLTDPPSEEENGGDQMVLENLETLQNVWNLNLGENVIGRIPNIKKLGINYDEESSPADYVLDNLCRLRKLECLSISCNSSLSRRIEVTSFPITLRKLTLEGMRLGWEKMGTKIGSLPYLEVLKLNNNAFVGPEWETAEGGFPSLKYLQIDSCSSLEQWRADATHFPSLERLGLWYLDKLNEIPLEIGDISTLREIYLDGCSDSAVLSAKKILEEQEECLGEVELQIRVGLCYQTQLRKQSLSRRNLFELVF